MVVKEPKDIKSYCLCRPWVCTRKECRDRVILSLLSPLLSLLSRHWCEVTLSPSRNVPNAQRMMMLLSQARRTFIYSSQPIQGTDAPQQWNGKMKRKIVTQTYWRMVLTPRTAFPKTVEEERGLWYMGLQRGQTWSEKPSLHHSVTVVCISCLHMLCCTFVINHHPFPLSRIEICCLVLQPLGVLVFVLWDRYVYSSGLSITLGKTSFRLGFLAIDRTPRCSTVFIAIQDPVYSENVEVVSCYY